MNRIDHVGTAGFPALLLTEGLLTRQDLNVAELQAARDQEEGPGVEKRVLELGADDSIIKPFDPEVLLSRVHAVFRRIKAVAA